MSPANFSFPQFQRIAVVFLSVCFLVFLVVIFGAGAPIQVIVKPDVTTRNIEMHATIKNHPSSVPDGETAVTDTLFASLALHQVIIEEPVAASKKQEKRVPAVIEVEVQNHYSRSQPLVRTTRFVTADGILYRLPQNVSVGVGETVTTQLNADVPGETREIRAGERLQIPGLWEGVRDRIYGVAIRQVHPGSIIESEVLPDDLIRAEQVVHEKYTAAMQALKDPAGADVLILTKEAEPSITAPEAGVTENPRYRLVQDVVVATIGRQDLRNYIRDFLSQLEQEKTARFRLDDIQFDIQDVQSHAEAILDADTVGKPETVVESMKVTLDFQAQLYRPVDMKAVHTDDFRGKNEKEILGILKQKYGIFDAEVKYSSKLSRFFGPIRIVVLDP